MARKDPRSCLELKAVRFHEHGGVEKLKYEDAPDPEIVADEVLVGVRACALNHLDIWTRMGTFGAKIPLPHICGSDVSGVVTQVGEASGELKAGEKVLVSPGLSCNRCSLCLSGRHNLCPSFQILGYQVDGGYAEYVKVPRENILAYPDGLSFEEAASIPLVFLTAWHILSTLAGVRSGEDVLVLAAGSGVGVASVQIAKLLGARVIATAGSSEKVERSMKLGADLGIDHNQKDFSEEALRLTNVRGVDVVVDTVGAATWEKSLKSLARGGRMVCGGVTTGAQYNLNIRQVYGKQLSIFGAFMGSKGEMLEVMKHVSSGRLRPVVDSVFPLEEAAKAHEHMDSRRHFGKIVLRI